MLQNQFSYIATLKVVAVLLLSGISTAAAQAIFQDSYEQAVAITSFSASADAIMQGQSMTISWSTVGAIACTPSGGTGDWAAVSITLPGGETSVVVDSDGEHTFTLTCNGVAEPAAVAELVVTATTNPTNCSAPTLAGNLETWKSFWQIDFPGPDNAMSRLLAIPRLGYLAIEFNTADIVGDGKITTFETTGTSGVGLGHTVIVRETSMFLQSVGIPGLFPVVVYDGPPMEVRAPAS